MKHKVSVIILLSIISLFNLTACSAFHLRGQNELPPALRVLYVQTDDPYGLFTATLRTTLRSSGVTLVDSPALAKVTLNVSKPLLANRGVTIGSSNQTRIYSVSYSVNYVLTASDGKPILPAQTLTTSRTLTLSPNQLLESNNQLVLLEQEMQRELINQLFNRLTSQQVAQALQ
jgi:LPS-assembly lipoprotein